MFRFVPSPRDTSPYPVMQMLPCVQLLLDRDPHGNVQVAKIETEVLLAQSVEAELEKLTAEGMMIDTRTVV